MIIINNKRLGIIYYKKTIAQINMGVKIVYQAIRSCFGSGRWRSTKLWIGKDKWKNN